MNPLVFEQPMYNFNGKKISSSDILAALQKVNVKAGDVIFVHSDVSAFGKLAKIDRDLFFQNLVDVFKESVGEGGTIIMPTFTYSFCGGKVFNVQKSASTVGALTEYFRKQSGVTRTNHPVFSVAVWGKNKRKFLKIGKDSYGKKSIFDLLRQSGGKLVFFGVSMKSSCTFLHHIEQSGDIPYRFLKTFKGVIVDKEKKYRDECTFFARYLDRETTYDFTDIITRLKREGAFRQSIIGNGAVIAVSSRDLFEIGFKMLQKNVYAFLKGKKTNEK
jgi:aminoglycoside 3-N-acetyltransferase